MDQSPSQPISQNHSEATFFFEKFLQFLSKKGTTLAMKYSHFVVH